MRYLISYSFINGLGEPIKAELEVTAYNAFAACLEAAAILSRRFDLTMTGCLSMIMAVKPVNSSL